MPDCSIAYLGPAGTYSDEAARNFARHLEKHDADFIPCSSFDEVFELVDRGKCTYGVVPTENSLEGAVSATLDNFAFNANVDIVAETLIPIHHNLLLAPGARLEDVTTIASHPQGLGQCRRYIAQYLPGRSTLSTSSTAASARVAVEDPTVAGIANAFAAELYGAHIEQSEIEDHSGNVTCFALIARPGTPAPFGPGDKTSLVLFLENDRAGALQMILSEFAYANVNLTKIQSRPTKQGLGDYLFFIDLDAAATDPAVQTALSCLRLKLREVKVLGSYPTLD